MNGLQELPLVLADPGVVHLPHQLGVLVDQPRLPENIRRRVFHLRRTNHKRPFQPPSDPKLLKGTVCIKCYYKYIINIHTQSLMTNSDFITLLMKFWSPGLITLLIH